MKKWVNTLLALLVTTSIAHAERDNLHLFPIEHYDQSISTWINPSQANYTKPLISIKAQQEHFSLFFQRFFGTKSPWNSSYVNQVLQGDTANSIVAIELAILDKFDNGKVDEQHKGFGENFRPYPAEWLQQIKNNLPLAQLDHLHYAASQRGIIVDNAFARYLPTNDPYFYNENIPGEGYPFDNLQVAAAWVGTPVYIITETQDQAWSLVLTPDFILWVKSSAIARVDNAFVNQWEQTAKQHLAAIIQNHVGINDSKERFLFTGYIGTVLPAKENQKHLQLFVPIADRFHRAVIATISPPDHSAAMMPLTPTPKQFAELMQTLVGLPYGWGNAYFYNDCSAELKNLFAPFGIWLPNHSSMQVHAGKQLDFTAEKASDRLNHLLKQGRGFMTLIYIGGHVVMYLGSYPNTQQHNQAMAMTYQNIWGLKPHPDTFRAVIGKAVFLPMLLEYPEDKRLTSLADKKYFQMGFLDEMPEQSINNVMNLPTLMQYIEE